MFIEHKINKCPKAPEGHQKPLSLQRSGMSVELMKHDIHCAPLERRDWACHDSIDMPPRWGGG